MPDTPLQAPTTELRHVRIGWLRRRKAVALRIAEIARESGVTVRCGYHARTIVVIAGGPQPKVNAFWAAAGTSLRLRFEPVPEDLRGPIVIQQRPQPAAQPVLGYA